MAETKTQTLEREYVIPLRNEWRKVANYRRTGKAVKEIKKFIARHMKVEDRDISRVKLDMYLNNEIWFRGTSKPPAKIKVRAKKEGDIVYVTLADMPEAVKFFKAKHEKRHKPSDKPIESKTPENTPEVADKAAEARAGEGSKSPEAQKDEKEKGAAVAEARAADAKQQSKAQKHLTKVKEPKINRMALKK